MNMQPRVTNTLIAVVFVILGSLHAAAAAGDLDTTFGSGGKVVSSFGASFDRASSVIVRDTGKILVVGFVDASQGRIGMVRYNPDGSLDTTFGAGGKAVAYFDWNGQIGSRLSAVVQSDGKIVVGSVLKPANSTNDMLSIARFNFTGTIDTSFSNDGYVKIPFSERISSYNSVALALQTDGRIVIAGTAWPEEGKQKLAMARVNSDGSLDSSFGTGGSRIFEETNNIRAEAVVVDANGRILIAGVAKSGPNNYGIVRVFNSGGWLEGSYFNAMSWLLSDPNYYGKTEFLSIALDSFGKVVVGGTLRGNDGSTDFLVARFHPDGNFDDGFNYTGYCSESFVSGVSEVVTSVMIQPDGKVIAAGATDGKIGLMRFTTLGLLDQTFGTGGKRTSTLGGSGAVHAARGANAKIIVVTESEDLGESFITVRFNSDGSTDSNFNPQPRTSGWVATEFGGQDHLTLGTVAQSDGKIVLAVGDTDVYSEIKLVRYNPDGSLDTSFGFNGKVSIYSLCFNGAGHIQNTSIAVQSDDKILIGGFSVGWCNQATDFLVARLNADGTLDSNFGTGGAAFADFSGGTDIAHALTVQEDGKIVAAGITTAPGESKSDFAVARFNTNGTLDTTFSTDGKTKISFGNYNAYATAVAVMPSHAGGKIVVAGYNTTVVFLQQNHDFAITRLNSDGTIDPHFGTAGKLTTDFGSLDSQVNDIVLSGLKLIAVGHARNTATGSDFALARYNYNGSLDTTFDGDGRVTTSFGSFNDAAFGVALQTDGKIVAVGSGHSSSESKDNFAVARYLSNGTLDTTFNLDGKVTTSFSSFSNAADGAKGVHIQPDGKIVAAGHSLTGVNYDLALARYQP